MAGRQLHLLQSNLSLNRLNQLPRKRRTFRRQLDPLTSYTDSELRCRYRFGRDAINYIIGLVADDIMPETNRNHAVSAEMQVLITLRYLASGSFLQVIGDTFLGFDKSTVSTRNLSSRKARFITVATVWIAIYPSDSYTQGYPRFVQQLFIHWITIQWIAVLSTG